MPSSSSSRVKKTSELQGLSNVSPTAFTASREGPPGKSRRELITAAQAAFRSRDIARALETWAEFRRLYPKDKRGYLGAIKAARDTEPDIARQLIGDALSRFPRWERFGELQREIQEESEPVSASAQDVDTISGLPLADALRYALNPVSVRHYSKAALRSAFGRLSAVQARYPESVLPFVAEITLLRKTKQLQAALALAVKLHGRFKNSRPLLLAEVRVLDDDARYEEALARLEQDRRKHTATPAIEEAYSLALSRVGRFQEADEVCSLAIKAYPNSAVLAREYASLANRRGDWKEAMSRWQKAAEAFPANKDVQKGLTGARLQLADEKSIANDLQLGETGKFFAQFESLGGTIGGCEFGMIQRHAGSLSLGLLRWANIRPEKLVEGLRTNFEGLGEIENTTLTVPPVAGDREEYVVVDKNYGLWSHTFISVSDAPRDKMLIQTARRLSYLRDKLLEELRQAHKLFVYKFHSHPADGIIKQIFEAARKHGKIRLLCVRHADAEHPAGTLEVLSDGLCVGYVGHFMEEAGKVEAFDHAGWTALCTKALAATSPDAHSKKPDDKQETPEAKTNESVSPDIILADLTTIMREIFLDEDLLVTREMWSDDIVGWSSFMLVEIILACQERYGIHISADAADALASIGDLVDTVQRTLESNHTRSSTRGQSNVS